jgi:ABC-type nitrate/sulfonate/bicarbonate transport system permease component
MVDAQQKMETPLLIALMFMAAMVGFSLDKIISVSISRYVDWKYQ